LASSELGSSIPGLRCPSCDSETANTMQTKYSIDHFGSVLLIGTSCQKCGYKRTDVLSLERREPILTKAKISSLADLDIKVVKSGTATIKIPEFGATITPGPYSEGFITNAEGVLEKVEDALTFMLGCADEKGLRKGEKMLRQIRQARESGKPRFTLVIEDPLGNSALISPDPSKIERRRLSRSELQKVKFGRYASASDITFR